MATVLDSSVGSVDTLVRDIYGSLVEDLDFEGCLRRLGQAFDAHLICLHTEDRALRRASLMLAGPLDATELARFSHDYATHWAGRNLWVERSYDSLLGKGYEDGDAVVSAKELLDSEYFRYFCEPLDVRFGLGISLRNDANGVLSLISVNRARSAGPFDEDDLHRVHALRPHLANAYAMYRRIAELQERAECLQASLDRVPLGMLMLDTEGRVLQQNAEAARLLAAGRGLSITREGLLRVAGAEAQKRLSAAIARLAPMDDAPYPEAILLADRMADGWRGATILHLCVLPGTRPSSRCRQARILTFVCEIDRHGEERFACAVLVQAMGLTPMEAHVTLSLRDHHDPDDVARAMSLAVSTVRTHLKHAFRKSGTTRQSELLRVVDRLLGAAPH